MQKKTDITENNTGKESFASILEGSSETNKSTSGGSDKFNDAMKQLDAIFEAGEEDLAWLNDILSDSGAKGSASSDTANANTKDEISDAEPEEEITETIAAENSVQVADHEVEDIPLGEETDSNISTVEAEEDAPQDSAKSIDPFDELMADFNQDNAAPSTPDTQVIDDTAPDDTVPYDSTNEAAPVSEAPIEDSLPDSDVDGIFRDDIDDDVTIYTGASDKETPAQAPGEVELDMFEGDSNIDYIHNVDTPDKRQESNVNNSLGKLFGLQDDEDENVKKKVKSHKKIAKELGAYEEINMADPDAVSAGQRHYYMKKCRSLIALLGVTFFLLLSLYSELAILGTLPSLKFLNLETANPVMVSLVNLQIMCFAAMCVLDSLIGGFYSILDRRFSPGSAAFIVFGVCTMQSVVNMITASKAPNPFCSIGCLALFMLALYNYFRASADDKAYRIASSTSNKFGAYELGTNSLECSPFASHIDLSKAKVISVCKGSVYDGFVGRNEKTPGDEKKLGRLNLLIFAAAIIIAIISAIFTNDVATTKEKINVAFTAFTVIFVSSVPLNLFLVSSLPKFLAAASGKNLGAALIGQNASEEYKGLSVVSFEDTEVFLPKDVRISSIKTYGGMALDEAVVIMSKIYGKIGGPLSKIFAKMVDSRNIISNVRLVKVYPDAIEVNVDGRDVCLATASYLGANGIRIITDSVDTSFEQSHGSILFMVCGGRVLAKFYIKYSMNPTFEKTLCDLHDANLCVGIKTLDPCITNELVFSCLENANYALSVIKGSSASDIPTVKNKVSSGVIALGNVHNFLEMLLICEKTGRSVKINNVIKIITAILCTLLSSVFVLFTANPLNATFCLIIQLFWLIPVTAISLFNK